jgi:hypothetical protein
MTVFWRWLIIVFVALLVAALIYGWYRTYKTQRDPYQEKFLTSTTSPRHLSGFYSGSVVGYHGSWKGKVFNDDAPEGINIFVQSGKRVERFEFNTMAGRDLRGKVDVLKIDYNIRGEPFWVKPVLDELVQTSPGHYLGKINYRLGLFSFSFGFFELTGPQPFQSSD